MKRRIFGTNGVRGIVNEGMDCALALQLGKAIGGYMGGKVALATDTRTSRDMLASAAAAGLSAAGADVIELGIVATPVLQHYVKTHEDVNGGVMVTASHNPPEFNGIKCVDHDGTELPRDKEQEVEDLFFSKMECADWDRVGSLRSAPGAEDAYLEAVTRLVDANAIRSAGLTVVMDCANGAAFSVGPRLMDRLGVRAITVNSDPQGKFPGHPSEPTKENLGDLISLVKASGADLGVAFDGDADRAVFVDDAGEYLTGDKSLAMIAKAMLCKSKGTVVTPVSSSSMVEDVVRSAGGTVEYTPVGSPVVARRMMAIDALFGGEENGGLIFPEHQHCRDGPMSAAKMLEAVVRHGPLSQQASSLPVYHTEKRKFPCPEALKMGLQVYAKELFADQRLDETDGVKLIYDDGWVLLRPSGTEPIFRIYSESSSPQKAAERADIIQQQLQERLEASEQPLQ